MQLSLTRTVHGNHMIVWNSEDRKRRLDIKLCWQRPGYSSYIGQVLRIKMWTVSLGFAQVGYYNAN